MTDAHAIRAKISSLKTEYQEKLSALIADLVKIEKNSPDHADLANIDHDEKAFEEHLQLMS